GASGLLERCVGPTRASIVVGSAPDSVPSHSRKSQCRRVRVSYVGAWAGAAVAVVVLAAAGGVGLLLRNRSGRFRRLDPPEQTTTDATRATLTSLGVTAGTPVT